MAGTAETGRVSRDKSEEDFRIYHVFIANLLRRLAHWSATPLRILAHGQSRTTVVSAQGSGCVGKIYRSRGMRKKPGHFQIVVSLAYFLRLIDGWSATVGDVPTQGEGSDAAGGKNTIRRATARQYGDIVKHRAVALDVEYRSQGS